VGPVDRAGQGSGGETLSTPSPSDEHNLREFMWVVALVALYALSLAMIVGLTALGLSDAAWEVFLTVW
jgi:hypothetical protein